MTCAGSSARLLRRSTAESTTRRREIAALLARIRPMVLNAAVNHGPGQAIRFVQQVCEAAGFGPLAADGQCGPRTRGAAAEADRIMGDWLLAALVEERRNFYLALVERHPEQRVFLGGGSSASPSSTWPKTSWWHDRAHTDGLEPGPMTWLRIISRLFRPARELIDCFKPDPAGHPGHGQAGRLALSAEDLAALQQLAAGLPPRSERTGGTRSSTASTACRAR
jgi:Predicted Peptidoglycan domain